MWDILSFNRFITQDVLVFFYYVSAIAMPVVLYLSRAYFVEHIGFVKIVNMTIFQKKLKKLGV